MKLDVPEIVLANSPNERYPRLVCRRRAEETTMPDRRRRNERVLEGVIKRPKKKAHSDDDELTSLRFLHHEWSEFPFASRVEMRFRS